MVPLVVSNVATHWDAILCLVAQKNVAPRLHTALLAAHVCFVAALLFCFTVCHPQAFHPATLPLVCMWQNLMHLPWLFPLLPRQNI
jgi:hypothetical protein